MILVDSSVWIDYFRDAVTRQVEELDEMLAEDASVFITPAIRMELLQGLTDELQARLVGEYLADVDMLRGRDSDFDQAAALYRAAQARGLRVRSSIDCLIAAQAIRAGMPLLHDDADFLRLAEVSDLRLVNL